MSTLFLIRHGQASFGTSNYDNLSERGVEQSRMLGEYWAGRGQKFDAVFTGAQERQKQTLDEVRKVYKDRGISFPETEEVLPEFNEYDARGIITIFFPRVAESDGRVKEIIKRSAGLASNSPEGRKSFQEVFEIMVDHWVGGKFESEHVESWEAFNGRVQRGISKITGRYGSGKTVAVFTSGGPISVSLRHVLGLASEVCIGLSWIVRNASITEFMYNPDKLTLTGFNMTPQFKSDSMITYR